HGPTFTQAMHIHRLWNRHVFSLVNALRKPLASGDGAAHPVPAPSPRNAMSPSPRLLSRCIRYSLAVCAVSACAVMAPAWAQSTDDADQQQPAELKSVVVTGSLIKHSDLATAQPVTTIGPQQIEDSGFKSV